MKSYSIGQVEQISGISVRMLRYYEEMGLVVPERTDANYRVYSDSDLRKLTHIVAMRACGMSVKDIRAFLDAVQKTADDNDPLQTFLMEHLASLNQKQSQVAEEIKRTRAVLERIERMNAVSAKDAFEKMKEDIIAQNEETYGSEVRAKWGNEAADASNAALRGMTEDEWKSMQKLGEDIITQLKVVRETGDIESTEAQNLVQMHARWIQINWGSHPYSRDAHLGLGQMYLADERFRAFYDNAAGEGATEILVAALNRWL